MMFLALFFLLNIPAKADLPPPADFVEECTLANVQLDGEECVVCHTYHGEPEACEQEHSAAGYQFRCRTSGASTWSEIWCRTKQDPGSDDAESAVNMPLSESKTPVAQKKSGCFHTASRSTLSFMFLLSVFSWFRRDSDKSHEEERLGA